MRSGFLAWWSGALIICFSFASGAQNYPSRPIRLISPFPPGSPSDTLGRLIGTRLAEALGQPLVIDNRAGAGGVIGVETVAKATPDGYTLVVASTGPLSISPALMIKAPYDTVKDFTPISRVVNSPFIFAVGSQISANTFKEFVALAKSKPRAFNYASTGMGSPTHLGIEQLKGLLGIELVHVIYKGSGLAITDMLSGDLHVMFTSIPVLLPYVKAGRMKALAVSGSARAPLLPAVPTLIDAGLPGFTVDFNVGFLAPRGTPDAIVRRLNREIVAIVNAPDMKDRLITMGAEPIASTPEEFRATIVTEVRRWAGVIKDIGIKPE